jgi:long-subunit fatty acid transport protein
MQSNPKSQEITMLKSALLATVISFAFILPASAQQVVPCDEPSLTKMRTEIDAMTDKAKQAETLTAWEAANTAFKANNLDECNARIGDASKNLPPATTAQ